MRVEVSKTQIDRLGARLRESPRIEDADLQLLQDLRSDHAEALEEVARRLVEGAGLEPTTRLKTVDTIIDKLQRQPHLVPSIQGRFVEIQVRTARGQLSVELHRRERALRTGLRGLIAGLAVRYSSE